MKLVFVGEVRTRSDPRRAVVSDNLGKCVPVTDDVLEQPFAECSRSFGQKCTAFGPRRRRTSGVREVLVSPGHVHRVGVDSYHRSGRFGNDGRDMYAYDLSDLAHVACTDVPLNIAYHLGPPESVANERAGGEKASMPNAVVQFDERGWSAVLWQHYAVRASDVTTP